MPDFDDMDMTALGNKCPSFEQAPYTFEKDGPIWGRASKPQPK